MYEVIYKELILDPITDVISHFECDNLTIVSRDKQYDPKQGFVTTESATTINVRDYSYVGFKEKLQREYENENT